MPMHRSAAIAATAAAALLAACGSSSTSSSAGGSSGFAAIQAAFANYGNQPTAHLKITEGGASSTSFDVDVTKDGMTGSVNVSGQQVGIVYAGGHGYVQTSPGGPFIQLPDADTKAFGLFTISTFANCFGSFLGSRAPQISTSVSSTTTTVNGTAAIDYKSPDGQAEIIISSGSNPLPLRLTGQNSSSSSSSSSSSTNPACDTGTSSSSSTSSAGGPITIDWSYPGSASAITPPPGAASST